MTDIAHAFDHGKAFIAFVTAGDPTIDESIAYAQALVEGGADLIELGIPFWDPIAEGPVIQAANVRALTAGANVASVFEMAGRLSQLVDVPLVFLTYLNPVFHMGYERFFARCAEAGISGVIIPDLPFEEQPEVRPAAESAGVDIITMVAPTSAERVHQIAEQATGFVYAVSSMGVTGVRSSITTDIAAMVAQIRLFTKTPVGIGFGIATPQQAAEMAQFGDAVIVGSQIVSIIAEHPHDASPYLRSYAAQIKHAIA